MSQSVGPLFDKQLTMSFPADIPVDLEGMFRRGPQWETGVEHIFVVETSSGSDEEAALEYVGQLSEVATTPLAGALQSSVGLVQQMWRHCQFLDMLTCSLVPKLQPNAQSQIR